MFEIDLFIFFGIIDHIIDITLKRLPKYPSNKVWHKFSHQILEIENLKKSPLFLILVKAAMLVGRLQPGYNVESGSSKDRSSKVQFNITP